MWNALLCFFFITVGDWNAGWILTSISPFVWSLAVCVSGALLWSSIRFRLCFFKICLDTCLNLANRVFTAMYKFVPRREGSAAQIALPRCYVSFVCHCELWRWEEGGNKKRKIKITTGVNPLQEGQRQRVIQRVFMFYKEVQVEENESKISCILSPRPLKDQIWVCVD